MPRIVLNPKVLTREDPRDGLCTAFNEAIRIVQEMNGFEPVSEPTEKQRKFFAETAYADDELQLRRTILARIATLDTSVKDPTDEQLEETAEMLEMVMEVGAPQNEWEQQAVQRLHDVVVKAREASAANGGKAPEPPEETGSAQADLGGGETDEDELEDGAVRYVEKDGSYYRQTYRKGESDASSGWNGEVIGKDEWDAAQKSLQEGKPPVDPMAEATKSALAGLANMEPEKAPEAAPVPSGTGMAGIPSGTGGKPPETAVAGAPGTSSPNWANGAVVGKDDPEAFGRVEHSWANGQDVAGFKDDADAFGRENPAPDVKPVKTPKAPEMPNLNWRGLASHTDARGRYFDNDGRVITKRQAERMERKKRKELGFA